MMNGHVTGHMQRMRLSGHLLRLFACVIKADDLFACITKSIMLERNDKLRRNPCRGMNRFDMVDWEKDHASKYQTNMNERVRMLQVEL